MPRIPVRLLMVLALAGCATQQTVWVRPGSTENEFYMDRGQCQAQAFGPGNVNLMQAAIIMNGCMQGKGWRQETR